MGDVSVRVLMDAVAISMRTATNVMCLLRV
jgi:hypothetical protein